MVKEIRIYIEGGGDGKKTKTLFKTGFGQFLTPLRNLARKQQIQWEIIVCGSRNNAYRDFTHALTDHPEAFNILLVDAESPIAEPPWQHLKLQDRWNSPGVGDRHCHLMVQAMEAWFIADIEALKQFYGQGFQENLIPKNRLVESIPKDLLESSLKAATRNTKSKGEYQKIQHGSALLGKIDPAKVRAASPYCDRLFKTLAEIIGLPL